MLWYIRRTSPEEHKESFQRWDSMQKIFISYSRKDMDFARKLAGSLEKVGYDVWWDITDLQGGDDWVRTIPAAIEASQYVLVVLSPNSTQSEWVQKEYTQALSLRKKIIPIMLDGMNVPFALNTINFVNFSSGNYTDNLKKLLGALGYTGEPPVAPPAEKTLGLVPSPLRKYALPIIIGVVILLLAFLWSSNLTLPVTQTPTPEIVLSKTPTVTLPPEVFTSTTSSTVTVTPTATLTSTATATPTPTLTSSPTNQPFEVLRYCVNSLYANTINVRSGPGTNYGRQGEPLTVGACLTFRAHNGDETWLLVAPDQTDPTLQQYEGGWIFRELLGLGLTGSIDLPAVTLTSTPTPSMTPTITPTFTRTLTATTTPSQTPTETPIPSLTPTDTPSPTEPDTPIPTDTPTP